MVTNVPPGPTGPPVNPFEGLRHFSKNAAYDQMDPLTVDQLVRRLDALPRAAAFPVYLKDGKEVENVRRITTPDDDPKTTYYVGTEKYEVVQHSDIGNELLRAVRETGADMRGVFRTTGNGARWYGTLLWEDQKPFEQLEKYNEPFKWGLNFSNSYDGGMSLHLESFGVRMICINYSMWGDLLAEQKVRHITSDSIGQVVDKMSEFMDQLVSSINDTFPHIYEGGLVPLEPETLLNLPELIVGHGITGVAEAATIGNLDNLRQLVPEADEQVTRWDAYNAATAFLSHYRAGITEETAHGKLRAATKLLDETKDGEAITRGQKKFENTKRGAEGHDLTHYKQRVEKAMTLQTWQQSMA